MKSIEAQKDTIDEQALAVLDRVEQTTKRLDSFEPLMAERTRLRDAAQAECVQRRQDTSERLGELERERAAAASQVPADAMTLFDEVADLHEGEAMSEVEVIDARHREYACSACNTEIPLAIYARLAGDTGKVVQCVSCKRILHMAATAVAEAARKR
jgi:predicted  nucleic acid-binding Zn-ribbon protein